MIRPLFLLVTLVSLCPQLIAQSSRKKANFQEISRPKLIIGLVVDQMRWDYLYRYKARYGQGGFNRLLKRGFAFENNFIPYVSAVTAAGHASIYTGSVPALHGIVGNEWVERGSGNSVYCTRDIGVQSVGSLSLQGQMSPKYLLTTTVGDELRLATNFRSKVFGVALKDRGGILAAGRSANACYWFDDATGNMITSTWYMNKLPLWVDRFNASRKADSLMASDWQLLYPLATYVQSTEDEVPYEKPLMFETTTTFPHSYNNLDRKNYDNFRASPYGNSYTLAFASSLIAAEQLGSGEETDMLCVSLSSTDYIGHRFGPNSLEVEDTYVRLDKDIEKFLKYLDTVVGSGNYVLFLSSDHGAPPVPDLMKQHNMSAGHLSSYFGLRDSLNKIGLEKLGVDRLVRSVSEYEVYIDHNKIHTARLNKTTVIRAFVDYLNTREEVTIAINYDDLSQAILPAAIKEMLVNGYYHKRSGDIHFILNANFNDVGSTGTEHGTIYTYDTHIPMVWFGWNIAPGRSYRNTYMTDIAPTVAAMLKIQMPNGSVGKVMTEVMP